MGDASARTVMTTRSGRRLTEAEIERLADKIEGDDFDLTGWTPRPGRPSLDASSSERSPRIAVRIPTTLRARVRLQAGREGRSISEVVRGLLEEYVRSGG